MTEDQIHASERNDRLREAAPELWTALNYVRDVLDTCLAHEAMTPEQAIEELNSLMRGDVAAIMRRIEGQ